MYEAELNKNVLYFYTFFLVLLGRIFSSRGLSSSLSSSKNSFDRAMLHCSAVNPVAEEVNNRGYFLLYSLLTKR